MLGKRGWGNSVFWCLGARQTVPGDLSLPFGPPCGSEFGIPFPLSPSCGLVSPKPTRMKYSFNTGSQTHHDKVGTPRNKMTWLFLLSGCSVNWAIWCPYRWVEFFFFFFFSPVRISGTGRSIERCVPFPWGFTLHIASLFQIPQYIASFLSRRHTSCRSVPWRLKRGEIKPVVDDSDILHCMSSAFIETYVCRVCVCVCVCLHVTASCGVCAHMCMALLSVCL